MLVTARKIGQEEAMCCAIEACGGVDALEKLQEHQNETVYEMALHIITEFFNEEVWFLCSNCRINFVKL